MSAALFRPLTPQWGKQKHWTDGSRMDDLAAEFIKPNDRRNAVQSAPKAAKRRKRIRPPKREKVYLTVHRHDNMLYYKRLDPEAFAILTALDRGVTVEDACAEAVTASDRANIDWAAQIKEWFDNWSALGWFCRPS
jgi:hypothetical protein